MKLVFWLALLVSETSLSYEWVEFIHTRDEEFCSDFLIAETIVPLNNPAYGIAVTGSDDQRFPITEFAKSQSDLIVYSAINGGYFGSTPYSYAKGSLGYESRSAVVKGPRACFIEDENRQLTIKRSLGRSQGVSLHPSDKNVLCAGPQLIENGLDIFRESYERENFETSGINPDASLPRSALCLRENSLILMVAQSQTQRSCGFTLPQLTHYLLERGCHSAMNLDGGGSSAIWQVKDDFYHYGYGERPVFQSLLVIQSEPVL